MEVTDNKSASSSAANSAANQGNKAPQVTNDSKQKQLKPRSQLPVFQQGSTSALNNDNEQPASIAELVTQSTMTIRPL